MRAERWLPRDWMGRIVVLGAAAFLAFFLWIPLVDTFILSLNDAFFLRREWVGLQNYWELTSDPVFFTSLGVSFRYALMVVPSVTVVGFVLAVLVNTIKRVPVRSTILACYFFAFVTPLVSVSVFWRFVFQPSEAGLLNAFLGVFGVEPQWWLLRSATALPALAVVGIWRHVGYVMVLFLAGLQSVPESLHEAAAIDGAGRWARVRHITIPLVMPTIAFVVIIMTLSSLMMFTETFVMTDSAGHGGYAQPIGGPNYATHTVVYNIYNQAFDRHREGYASAIAAVFFCLMVLIGAAQFRYLRAKFEY